jgi:hypothetical protein
MKNNLISVLLKCSLICAGLWVSVNTDAQLAVDVSHRFSSAIATAAFTSSYTGNYAISLPGGLGTSSNIAIPGMGVTQLPFTIEMWFKPEAKNNYGGLWVDRSGAYVTGLQFDAGNNYLRFDYGGTARIVPLTAAIPAFNKWHHVAAVVTYSSITVYLDGIKFEKIGLTNTYLPFKGVSYIGLDSAKTTTDRTVKGLYDEIRFWKTARTAEELEANKYLELAGNEDGLAGYWKFNDHATTASDSSGRGLNGIITGGSYSLSTVFDTMLFISSNMSQKSYEVNTPSLNNNIARLEVITANQNHPFVLTKLYLNTSGTSSLTDISNVKVFYTAGDSVFNTSYQVSHLGTSPSDVKFILDCNQKLKEGSNYFWITYDLAKNVTKGNQLDIACDSFVLQSQTYMPNNSSPSGKMTVNADLFMPNVKLPIDVVSAFGQTPSGGANFVAFQQNAIMTFNGYQYVTYWNNAFRVCLARKKLPIGSWEIIEFQDYTVTAARIKDNHYSISVGICPNDGTIHLSFDQHGDNLHYRKSVVGLANKPGDVAWLASSFGAVQNYLISGQPMVQVTYPRFVIKPTGDLLFEYRYGTSGGGNSLIYDYSALTGAWTKTGTYVDGLTTTNNNAYLNGIHYDANGRLHASWVWRETPEPLTNHDVCYVYSDDDGKTWFNYLGVQMGAVNTNPIKSTTSGIIVWPLNQNRGLINQESQVVDSKGGVHILQSFLFESEPNSTNFWTGRANANLRHIYKNESGIWQCDTIGAIAANRSQIAIDEGDNLYVVAPNYRIYYASSAEKWKKWIVFDISESNGAINEGLIDREMLLNESVLSFVFAQSAASSKIIVPYYLIDKSKAGKGTGLNVSVFSGADFGSHFYQKLQTVDLTSGNIIYSIDSVSVRCLGTIETKYAEAYTLHFTTTSEAKVWINEVLVLNTGTISAQTTFPITLALQPSHKYQIKIEGIYATPNVITKLEWESSRQIREIIPITALYGTLVNDPVSVAQISMNKLQVRCQPNPFIDHTVLNLEGNFVYKLYDVQGTLIREGNAVNQSIVGEGLSKGVYLLNVIQGQNSQTIKLIKI